MKRRWYWERSNWANLIKTYAVGRLRRTVATVGWRFRRVRFELEGPIKCSLPANNLRGLRCLKFNPKKLLKGRILRLDWGAKCEIGSADSEWAWAAIFGEVMQLVGEKLKLGCSQRALETFGGEVWTDEDFITSPSTAFRVAMESILRRKSARGGGRTVEGSG